MAERAVGCDIFREELCPLFVAFYSVIVQRPPRVPSRSHAECPPARAMADAASADASSAESADARARPRPWTRARGGGVPLDGRHLCSAFELYRMDLLASSADAAGPAGRGLRARAPRRALLRRAPVPPRLDRVARGDARRPRAPSRGGTRGEPVAVAEYDARVAREDLERVTRERDDARRELDATRGASSRAATPRRPETPRARPRRTPPRRTRGGPRPRRRPRPLVFDARTKIPAASQL